ncbi:MAG: hypothetical protein AB9907_08735 [Flexilinea sp.]
MNSNLKTNSNNGLTSEKMMPMGMPMYANMLYAKVLRGMIYSYDHGW